jgi:hypothetical protein
LDHAIYGSDESVLGPTLPVKKSFALRSLGPMKVAFTGADRDHIGLFEEAKLQVFAVTTKSHLGANSALGVNSVKRQASKKPSKNQNTA